MKKILLGLGILILIMVLAGGIFLATFDINRYRPLILKQIQTATGKQARIGRMALVWKGGIAARVDQVALYDTGDAEPDASVDQVLVQLQLTPLLRKEVRVSGVWISGPTLVVERAADGTISVAGIRPSSAAAKGQAATPTPASAVAVAFQVDEIKISDAKIRWIDHSPGSAMDLTLSDLDVDVKNIAPGQPVTFAARAAVFGSKQNVALGGRLTPPSGSTPAHLENFTVQADLGSIDLEKLSDSIPSVRAAGLRKAEGLLEAHVAHILLSPSDAAQATAELSLKKGSVSLAAVALPLENVELNASLRGGDAEVQNLSARLADGQLQFRGTVKNISRRPALAFQASAENLSVGKLATIASPQAPRLEGRLSLSFEGRGEGLDAASISQTLTGQGRLALKDGVLVNSNPLRTIVQKIAKIPGVGESAISKIPPQYLAKINEPSTILRPFEAPFAVQQGRVFFERLSVPTELFLLEAAGSVGLDRSIALQAAIVLDRAFSQALAAVAPPVQYLMNPAGQVQVQSTVQGVPPDVQVIPNLDAAIQRFAVDKGQQLVSDLLSKKDKKEIFSNLLSGPQQSAGSAETQSASGGIPVEPAPGQASTAQQPAQEQSSEDALMNLLGSALKKDKQQ